MHVMTKYLDTRKAAISALQDFAVMEQIIDRLRRRHHPSLIETRRDAPPHGSACWGDAGGGHVGSDRHLPCPLRPGA